MPEEGNEVQPPSAGEVLSQKESSTEFARLAERLITAEQDERRRLALFLHDGPVQSLSGIALMLDAVVHAIDQGKLDDAKEVLTDALERHRAAIRTLRELSFNLEPVVLRDRGFTPAVQALADELGLRRQIKIDVDVAAAELLGEKVQAALYQIVREALDGAVRRGPPGSAGRRSRRRSAPRRRPSGPGERPG